MAERAPPRATVPGHGRATDYVVQGAEDLVRDPEDDGQQQGIGADQTAAARSAAHRREQRAHHQEAHENGPIDRGINRRDQGGDGQGQLCPAVPKQAFLVFHASAGGVDRLFVPLKGNYSPHSRVPVPSEGRFGTETESFRAGLRLQTRRFRLLHVVSVRPERRVERATGFEPGRIERNRLQNRMLALICPSLCPSVARRRQRRAGRR